MRKYRRIRNCLCGFLAAYFVVGLLMVSRPDMEVFPVFSWFLFARVPQSGPQYALLLHEVNGQKLEPPRLYQACGDLVREPHSVAMFKLTQQFGAVVERNLTDKKVRNLLENRLPPQTRYELVKLNENPIVRWKTGRYEITKSFGVFNVNDTMGVTERKSQQLGTSTAESDHPISKTNQEKSP